MCDREAEEERAARVVCETALATAQEALKKARAEAAMLKTSLKSVSDASAKRVEGEKHALEAELASVKAESASKLQRVCVHS